MSGTVLSKSFSDISICEKEILRYCGCNEPDSATIELLRKCLAEAEKKLCYRVCYLELDPCIENNLCDFGVCRFSSSDLAKALEGCHKAIVFGATLGAEFDRLITKYSRVSPSTAVMLQAIGTERIEALCDEFCRYISKEKGLCIGPRFSPGYGDLPLAVQTDIFTALDCERRIGLTLNGSLIMSPSKSVTAIVGLSSKNHPTESKCKSCSNNSCEFRSEL